MSEILSGWKDIANYMGKGVRTVQRYGRELGLPVRRISAKPKASVLVTKAELDVWIHAAFNHQDSHKESFVNQESSLVNLENLKSRTSELRAGLEQLKQSINELATAREELAMSRRTVRQTARRVHENVFQTRVHPKNGSSRVA